MNTHIRIVILNYNESQFTIDLAINLQEQSFKNFEIIVVDNNSNYQEREILKRNLKSDVLVIYSDMNKGYAGGNNLGLKYQGDKDVNYHLILNNDIIIEDKNFIKTLLDGMKSYENIVASSPLVDTISSHVPLEKQIQVRRILTKCETFFINIPLFNLFTKKIRYKFLYEQNKPYVGKQMLCDTINGAAFLIDDKFLKLNNYLDEGTFLYHEEIILGKQIKDKGMTCLLNGNTSIKHLQGISTKNNNKRIDLRMERYKYQSSLYYLRKYENLNQIASLIYIVLSEFTILVKKLLFYKRYFLS